MNDYGNSYNRLTIFLTNFNDMSSTFTYSRLSSPKKFYLSTVVCILFQIVSSPLGGEICYKRSISSCNLIFKRILRGTKVWMKWFVWKTLHLEKSYCDNETDFICQSLLSPNTVFHVQSMWLNVLMYRYLFYVRAKALTFSKTSFSTWIVF